MFLFHGDYHIGSRTFLLELINKAKDKQQEVIQLDGKKIDLNQLIQSTTSHSLFGGEKIVVIENLLSRPKSTLQKEIFNWLKKYKDETDLIFWEGKSIGKVAQRNLPVKTTVKEFKTPALIFKLVEQISPDQKPQALQTLEQLLKNTPAEFIFAMIIRQIRFLILISQGKTITGAPWMIGKLKKQASFFNKENLLECYHRLYQIDKSVKTGHSIMGYDWHLSVWLGQI